MGNPLCRVLSVTALLLTAPNLSGQEIVRAGKKFELVLHPGDLPADLAGQLADQALAVVEATLPILGSWQVTPARQVVVHLCRDEADFRKVERTVAPAPFQRPFFVDAAAVAYVPLLPQFEEATLRTVGLPPLARDMLVVAGVAAAAQQRFPMAAEEPWLGEIVGFGALEELRNRDNAFGIDPGFDSRRWRHTVSSKPRLSQWLVTDMRNQATYEFSVEAQCLIAQLGRATGSGWVKKLLGSKKGKSNAKLRELAITALLGESKAAEGKWSRLLADLRPEFRVRYGSVDRAQGRLQLVGQSLLTWLRPQPATPFVLRGRCELGGEQRGQQQAGVWIARGDVDKDEDRPVAVFFAVGEVTLRRHNGQGMRPIASGEVGIAAGVPFEYSIHVETTVRVAIDGKQVLEVPGLTQLAGSWGIGSEGARVWFESPRLESAAAGK